jgi:hypothetical protein
VDGGPLSRILVYSGQARTRAAFVAVALVANLLLVGGPGASDAHACTCAIFPLEKEIRRADAVFSGEVQGIDGGVPAPGGGSIRGKIAIDVQESWKGVSAESVDVYGQGDGVNCYNQFERGETYLVYAARAEKKGDEYLKNIACGATKPLDDAGADLRLLGSPEGSLPDTGGYGASAFEGAAISAAVFALLALAGKVALRRGMSRPR